MGTDNISAYEKKKWVSLTGLCNNNCIFCLDGDRTDRFHKSEEKIKDEINSGIAEGATRLVLSGGEPTIHPKLVELIKYGKSIGYKKIQIVSNGRMLAYKSFVTALKKAGLNEVTFSIHGHTSELHESLTNVKGSFNQSVMGIRHAINAGFIVNTDTVITKKNYMHLPEIIEFLHGLGVYEVNLMSLVPFGNAWKNKEKVMYDFNDIRPYIIKVIEYCEDNNLVLWFSRFPAQYLEGYERYIESYKKLLEDVRAIGEDFFKRRPFCFGERCNFCGISTICNHLVNSVKNKDGDLYWYYKYNHPPCINDKSWSLTSKRNKIYVRSFDELAEGICKNSTVKAISCKNCVYEKECSGVSREYIRDRGFSILHPIMSTKK